MKKEIEKKYNFLKVEEKKYNFWIEKKLFSSKKNNQKTFTILLPPPNVTGKLHIGHALDATIADFLIRYKKFKGYNTNWIPGMDHAGIATQAKVEEKLWLTNKLTKYDLGREKFIKKVWEWKDDFAKNIKEQWSKLGLALNYDMEYFTYSKELNEIVKKTFVRLYNEKIIYRKNSIIHWDCFFKTAVSNIEVNFKEVEGKLYYFKYYLKNSKKDYLQVATTRPETIFADVCLVVNPNDERYKKYVNNTVINPLNNQELKIISDEYVEIDFGTGVMKCSPGHDFNDFDLAMKHNLQIINIFNDDGSLNNSENVNDEFIGMDKLTARNKVIEYCKNNNTYIKEENILHNVGFSERSNAVVEPLIREQWFIKMDGFAKKVIELQKSENKINIYPKRLNEKLIEWMENVHDWTISRQIWWGHQIPAWFHKKTGEVYVGVEPPKDIENYQQDSDVLDTWFSSSLLPFSIFLDTEKKSDFVIKNEYKKMMPTNVLVTGYDLIFFWVSRMIFFNNHFSKNVPFKNVLFHGLVRDEQNRKMSKSLGNGIDPMEIIDNYGVDSLRLMLTTNSSPGSDIRFSIEKIRNAWNFINKLWNASRFVLMNIDVNKNDFNNLFLANSDYHIENDIDYWILNKLFMVEKEVSKNFDNYEFAIAGKILKDFVWNDFCSNYIELTKINLNSKNEAVKKYTCNTMIYCLKNILIMLHGLIPFVTEEIYQSLNLKDSIMNEDWLIDKKIKHKSVYIDILINLISSIREFKLNNKIANNQNLEFYLANLNKNKKDFFDINLSQINNYIIKITNCKLNINKLNNKEKTIIAINDFALEIENDTFINKEKQKLEIIKKITNLENEIKRSKGILSNQQFLKNASKEKIRLENEKYKNYQSQLDILKKQLN